MSRLSILAIDITDRKNAEQALKEKTRLNQILLDAFPCVALLLRPFTREIVAANAEAVKAGALPGTKCFSTWGQRQDPCPWCLAPALWATGEAQHLEVEAQGIAWDAHWIPVAEDLYMHFALDVTARKQAEEVLKQASEYLSLATTAGGVGIWNLDVVNNKLTWDDQMFRLYGMTPEKFGGAYETWKAGVHPEDVERGDAEVQMALRGEKEFDTEFRVVWPNGTIRHINARRPCASRCRRPAHGNDRHKL